MSRSTYHMEIECKAVASDLHDTQVVTIGEGDDRQSLRVARGFLTEMSGQSYLPVRVVGLDREGARALVQLPYEADSGANRIWVDLSKFRRAESKAPAGNVA